MTARDIAVMAATLANRGVNPVTGDQVMTPYAISRTLSVMTSSGRVSKDGRLYLARHPSRLARARASGDNGEAVTQG